MSVRLGFAMALIGAIVMGATPAKAAPIDIDGAHLNGVFIVNNGGNNLFDPSFGKVPPGFGNSSSADGGSGEPFALVSDSIIEFGYEGGSVGFVLSLDFTSAGLITITGNGPAPASFNTIGVSVVSPSFPGLSIAPVTSTPFGSCNLADNTFACNFGTVTAPFTLVTQLTPGVAPEPASLALLGVSLAGLAARWRQRRDT